MSVSVILGLCLVCLQATFVEAVYLPLGKCDNKVKYNIKPDNGNYSDTGKLRVYKCLPGYVMNINAELKDRQFRCQYNDGHFTITNRRYPQLSAKDIRCEKKFRCKDPVLKDNVEIVNTIRYKQAHYSKTYGPMKREGFYDGDVIEYKCKQGFTEASSEPHMSNDVFSYDIYDDQLDNLTHTGMCVKSHGHFEQQWRGIDDLDLEQPICKPIQCDASRFNDTYFGYIENLRENFTYEYLEYIELQCLEGYSPIGGVKSAVCHHEDSFGEMSLPILDCEETQCPAPGKPLNGDFFCDSRFLTNGTTCTFSCPSSYTMIGNPVWTCGIDGRWNGTCVKCIREDQYCESPCVPLGAVVMSLEPTFSHGSEIEFACSDQHFVNGTLSRKCMANRKWQGADVDCLGDRYFDRQDAFDLATSLENIRDITSNENTTSDDAILTKSMDPDSETCCDVYFLIDMSKSMTDKDFEKAKNFTKALLPKIGISDEESATRIALYLFAQDVNKSIDDIWKDEAEYTNYTQVEAIIDKLVRKEIFGVVGVATDLSKALYRVQIAAETKRQLLTNQNRGLRENVLIILSDGDYTGGGNPAHRAKILKDNLEFQIYSIAIGESRKGMNLPILQQIASQDDIDNPLDKHFVTIEGKDLRTTTGVCGGSQVLTAAHCFEKNITDVRSHTCPEPWKDKLKTMYEDKKRYPNKTSPANFLILRTCDSHYAEYAVLVIIIGHGYGNGEQGYSDVSAEVLTVFNHGQEGHRRGITMHVLWRMDCKWPIFLKGKKYYIIARDGLPYTDDAGNKIFKYYIREGDIVLEWRKPSTPVGKFMVRGYERFWIKGKQCPK